MSHEIGEDYASSLADLTMNSKPLINMLTILAEESIEHAAVIVQSVEKHLDQVRPGIKLPVLYLVDSIIKNVGGAYTQLFSQIIVNMFCRVFRQVDENTRSQMFKLRETWHEVFPSVKLYQLDVKVSLIDPAWPIQAQPPQGQPPQSSNIHVNPIFFKNNSPGAINTPLPSTSLHGTVSHNMTPEEEEMRNVVALKEQELLFLQKKKIELELEQAKKLLEQSKSSDRKAVTQTSNPSDSHPNTLPSAVVAVPSRSKRPQGVAASATSQAGLRILPVSPSLLNRRRDPRLARNNTTHSNPEQTSAQGTSVLDGKPSYNKAEKNHKLGKLFEDSEQQNKDDKLNSKHVTLKKDPRLNRNKHSEATNKQSKSLSLSKRSRSPNKNNNEPKPIDKREKLSCSPDSSRTISPRANKLPPIPKIKYKTEEQKQEPPLETSPTKRKKENSRTNRIKKSKLNSNREHKRSKSPSDLNKKSKLISLKYDPIDIDPLEAPPATDVTFKELKISTKQRNYMIRNKEKSESPEKLDTKAEPSLKTDNKSTDVSSKKSSSTKVECIVEPDVIGNGVAKKDVDLRLNPKCAEVNTITVSRKRLSSDKSEESSMKKIKTEKFDALFGDEDVDLRKLPLIENATPPPTIAIDQMEDITTVDLLKDIDGGWAKVKEIQSPQVMTPKSHFNLARSKHGEMPKNKDPLGRPLLYKCPSGDENELAPINSEDTDMRQQAAGDLNSDGYNKTIETILSQAGEHYQNGEMDGEQYNVLVKQVMLLNETQKLKEAQKKDSLERSQRKLNWVQKRKFRKKSDSLPSDEDTEGGFSPQSDEADGNNDSVQPLGMTSTYGDIDERIVLPICHIPSNINEGGKRPPLLPRPDMPFLDSDLRMHPNQMSLYDKQDAGFMSRGPDMRFPNRHMPPRMYGSKVLWRGMRPRMEERGFRPRGLLPPPILNNRRMPSMNNRLPFDPPPHQVPPFVPKGPFVGLKQMPCPIAPYVYDEHFSPPALGASSASKNLLPVDPKVIEYIDQDTMRTIQIDGTAREIRYYDKTAIIMENWDCPKEISFDQGHRRITFDDESFVLNLNDDYVNVTIDGQPHQIRFGAPTREVYIDDCWYEAFFGGPSVPIMLDNKVKHMTLDGPPPPVKIGKLKRTDLVAGKINLIVDAIIMLPVYLDAKLQKFEIDNVIYTLRFVDALQTILINEKPFKVEFGGLPKPFFVGKRKHFVRFSVLPRGLEVGQINIKNMEGKKPSILSAPDLGNNTIPANMSNNSINDQIHQQNLLIDPFPKTVLSNPDSGKHDAEVSGGLDILASVLPSLLAPPSQSAGYSIADTAISDSSDNKTSTIPGLDQQDMSVPPPSVSVLQNLNVNDLFAKLVASGIMSALPTVANPVVKNEPAASSQKDTKFVEKSFTKTQTNVINPVDLLKSDTLKVRQPGLITSLHTGMQCGGCGARFPPEHTVRYSQHLDWHFRQNRADRHSQRRPNSRRWYYDISDWVQYQEIEDLEEREKSWFEREQQAAEAARSEEAAVVAARREQSSVPLKSDAPPELLRCHLCHDTFHQFYNHDIDEWHLRNAVEHEGNNYHPICLDDHKVSLIKDQEKSEEESKEISLIVLDKENNDSISVENEDILLTKDEENNEDARDIVEQDNESVVEVLSEEAATQESTVDEAPDVELVEEDDDVVIKNEPVEQIIVDDIDTDEETEKERQARDEKANDFPIDFANVKIKLEPIDPDDEPIITSEGVITAQADTTYTSVMSSIDGNVQLEPTAQAAPVIPVGGIRINITKPLVSQQPKDKEIIPAEIEEIEEPLPPGEEPVVIYKLKSSLEGKTFSVQPPTNRGSEVSGLCSIM